MGAKGSQRNQVAGELKSKCLKGAEYTSENAQYCIQCSINFVKSRGFEVEVHFDPQALEFAFATQMLHVPVAIFDYEKSYNSVLTEIGIDPDKKEREGNDKKVQPVHLLRELSTSDYTEEMKQQVCELYEVDVIMHRSLGFSSSCDAYI